MTLPGILPPDAGRLERAARRYVIAVLSRHCVLRLPAHKDGFAQDRMREAWDVLSGCSGALYMAYSASVEPETPPWRLLRARVALYLRWCERVERGDVWGWWDGWGRYTGGVPVPWHSRNELLAHGVRWAVPLWTLAPAHDPAVSPAMRRATRRKA